MLSITVIFLLGAIVAAIASAIGKAPLWVSVILTQIVLALQILPR